MNTDRNIFLEGYLAGASKFWFLGSFLSYNIIKIIYNNPFLEMVVILCMLFSGYYFLRGLVIATRILFKKGENNDLFE